MFHVRKPSSDHIASTLAFVLLLASWCVAYATFLPPDVRPARTHIALQVRL